MKCGECLGDDMYILLIGMFYHLQVHQYSINLCALIEAVLLACLLIADGDYSELKGLHGRQGMKMNSGRRRRLGCAQRKECLHHHSRSCFT